MRLLMQVEATPAVVLLAAAILLGNLMMEMTKDWVMDLTMAMMMRQWWPSAPHTVDARNCQRPPVYATCVHCLPMCMRKNQATLSQANSAILFNEKHQGSHSGFTTLDYAAHVLQQCHHQSTRHVNHKRATALTPPLSNEGKMATSRELLLVGTAGLSNQSNIQPPEFAD